MKILKYMALATLAIIGQPIVAMQQQERTVSAPATAPMRQRLQINLPPQIVSQKEQQAAAAKRAAAQEPAMAAQEQQAPASIQQQQQTTTTTTTPLINPEKQELINRFVQESAPSTSLQEVPTSPKATQEEIAQALAEMAATEQQREQEEQQEEQEGQQLAAGLEAAAARPSTQRLQFNLPKPILSKREQQAAAAKQAAAQQQQATETMTTTTTTASTEPSNLDQMLALINDPVTNRDAILQLGYVMLDETRGSFIPMNRVITLLNQNLGINLQPTNPISKQSSYEELDAAGNEVQAQIEALLSGAAEPTTTTTTTTTTAAAPALTLKDMYIAAKLAEYAAQGTDSATIVAQRKAMSPLAQSLLNDTFPEDQKTNMRIDMACLGYNVLSMMINNSITEDIFPLANRIRYANQIVGGLKLVIPQLASFDAPDLEAGATMKDVKQRAANARVAILDALENMPFHEAAVAMIPATTTTTIVSAPAAAPVAIAAPAVIASSSSAAAPAPKLLQAPNPADYTFGTMSPAYKAVNEYYLQQQANPVLQAPNPDDFTGGTMSPLYDAVLEYYNANK